MLGVGDEGEFVQHPRQGRYEDVVERLRQLIANPATGIAGENERRKLEGGAQEDESGIQQGLYNTPTPEGGNAKGQSHRCAREGTVGRSHGLQVSRLSRIDHACGTIELART